MFQLPLIVIMPLLFGLDGVLYAGPLADLGTFVLCMLLVRSEFKNKFE
jgi:hypothetical protein